MNEKRKILQCLIENRAFAPSASALAKNLGYESNKATLYRIMRDETKDSTVDDVWDKLLEEHCLTERHLHNLARIFEGAAYFSDLILPEMDRKHPKWLRYLLLMLTDDDYEACSLEFQQETAPILKDLKADEPDVYWGIVTVIYIRCRNIDPYKENPQRTFCQLIDELDNMLSYWYPERTDAHEISFNLKELTKASNLWKIIENCTILFRRYTEADFSSYASQSMMLFGWDAKSFWRIPGHPYLQGSQVWVLVEHSFGRATNGCYIVLCLEAGKDICTFVLKDALVFCFWSVDKEDDPLILQACRGTGAHREWCFYAYGYDEETHTLYLEANPATGNLFGLPEAMKQINLEKPKDKEEKVWARIMNKWDKEQGNSIFEQAKALFAGRIDLKDTYQLEDVSISRTCLKLFIRHNGDSRTYQLPIEAYDFLQKINPTQQVLIVRHTDDQDIYVEWPEMGYGIKLSEFEVH